MFGVDVVYENHCGRLPHLSEKSFLLFARGACAEGQTFHIPILLIAGDFLQIKPANEISLADDLEELVRKMLHRVQTEHHAAQEALKSIDSQYRLKKSKQFLDAHLPERLSDDHFAQPRSRKIENCKKDLATDLFKHGNFIGMYWEHIARSMVERANRDVHELDEPFFFASC